MIPPPWSPVGLTPQETHTHEQVRDWFAAVEGPGVGRVSAGGDPAVTADGARLAMTAVTVVGLDRPRRTGVVVLDLATGGLRTVGRGDRDRLPRWSPDGRRLAFLADHGTVRRRPAWTEPDRLDAVVAGPDLPGSAEQVDFSPAGDRLLAVMAEGDAAHDDGPTPSWWPALDRASEPTGWRRCHVIDLGTSRSVRVSPDGLTVWEAVWAGPAAIAAVVSDGPGEEAWYTTRLVLLPVPAADAGSPADATGQRADDTPGLRVLHRTEVQLGRPAASPSGRRVAVVESFCSDRSLVAGDLVLLDTDAVTAATRLDTLATDVAHCAFRGEDVLFFVGVRGQQTVAGEVDLAAGTTRELWVSDGSTAGVYPQAAQDAAGVVHAVSESYAQAPRVIRVRDGREEVVADLAHPGSHRLLQRAGSLRRVHWDAEDGLPLDGLLVTPDPGVASPPYPLVLDIHGGPVWTWHDQYAMRGATGPLLASRGYAVLYVNHRGSTGKGQDFARSIAHDMHGQETGDFLTAVDHLVAEGIADPSRVGLTGTSYGGTMALWLITQDQRFAAAVAVSAVTDFVSFHHTTSIADFDLFFLPGDPLDVGGEYVRRSPLTHVARVRTPVLMLTGQRDLDVPASQGREMHRALTMHGKVSELLLYPEEGHVIGDFPGVVDATARTLAWFEHHMPPGPPAQPAS